MPARVIYDDEGGEARSEVDAGERVDRRARTGAQFTRDLRGQLGAHLVGGLPVELLGYDVHRSEREGRDDHADDPGCKAIHVAKTTPQTLARHPSLG